MHTSQNTTRAADRLIAIFETEIRSGSLREGDPLPPEREIVQTYQVSRTVAREAVLALANKGLVEARPRHRPVVRAPSYDAAVQAMTSVADLFLSRGDAVVDLFNLRILAEAALARRAATSARTEHLEKMKAALAANESAIEDSELFYLTDTAFHAVLYEIADNPILPAVHRAYTGWLSPQWKRMPRLPERNRQNYEAHKAIFDAILLRDADSAEAALRRHLSDAWAQVRLTFEDLPELK